MRTIAHIAAAAVLLGCSGAAVAADFTLDVPVRVRNVPSLTMLTLECFVSRVAVDAPYAAGGSNVIGRGRAPVPVSGGEYDGSVTVEVENTGIIPSASARSYGCFLSGAGRATTGATYSASPGNFGEVIETATGQRIDRAVVTIAANLP